MNRNTRSSHRRNLRNAFLVTTGAAVALAGTAACETTLVIANPAPPQCPTELPNDGDACEGEMTCQWDSGTGCPDASATCANGVWSVTPAPPCNPPPPDCPTEVPNVGDSCEEYNSCAYTIDTPCGPQNVTLACEDEPSLGELVWAYVQAPTCEASPEDCQLYGASGACDADPGCAWRVPSCGPTQEAPDVEAGCYPAAACDPMDADSCGTWGTCEMRSYDPCWNSLCNACGASDNICVPNTP